MILKSSGVFSVLEGGAASAARPTGSARFSVKDYCHCRVI